MAGEVVAAPRAGNALDIAATTRTVAAAPADDPNRPMNREETIAWHRARGLEVIENDDGSYTIMPMTKGKPTGA